MATYRLSAQVIKRSDGRSVVASASYRAAEKLKDHRLSETFDFTRKGGVEHSEILLPKGAPAWMADREQLWNAVEKSEKRKDAQLAREVQVSLPRELSAEQQLSLVRAFVQEQMVERGMVADVSIHRDNPDNPHAHILLTTRVVTPDGFGKKLRQASEWFKRKDELLEWREQWARHANLALEHAGEQIQIDHRSYADQGIALEPQSKIGRSRSEAARDARDIVKERLAEHDAIARRNGEAIIDNPLVALDAIVHQRATFTRSDVGRFLNTHTADAEQFQQALNAVMASPELIRLAGRRGEQRYTTREMIRVEMRLESSARALERSHDHWVAPHFVRQAERGRTLSEEQRGALEHLAQSGNVAVIEGRAGSGKSYMLGAAREAWEAQGYQVKGAALAGKAAEGLQISSGITSRSLASWEYAWKRGRDELGKLDVLVIDEAGMVGTRQMQRVLEHVEQAGAKVVLVGDTEQLQAIEAGAALRAVREHVGAYELSEIRRQQVHWQREAAQELARGETLEALRRHQSHGHVHGHATQAEAIEAVVAAWKEGRKREPGQSQIMLAYRRDEVQQLNELARAHRKELVELGADHRVQTARGARDFASGDRLYFLKNDRGLEVKNGTLGTIEEIRGHSMSVRLDDGRQVAFDNRDYNHLDHGYAGTVHKGQGITVDRAYVLASQLYDRHATYVGLSRQRWHAELHWSHEQFEDAKQMASQLSRARPKDMALDYAQVERSNQKLAKEVAHGALDRGRLGVRDPTVGREPGPVGERDRAGLEREPRAHGPGAEHGGSDDAHGLEAARRGDRARECEPPDFGEHREGGPGVDQEYRSESRRAPGERDSGRPKGEPCLHPENGSPGHSHGDRGQPGYDRHASLGKPADRAARPEHSQGRGVRDVRQHEAGRVAREGAPSGVRAAEVNSEQALRPSTQRLVELAARAEERAKLRDLQQRARERIQLEAGSLPRVSPKVQVPVELRDHQEPRQEPRVETELRLDLEDRLNRLEKAYELAWGASETMRRARGPSDPDRRMVEGVEDKAREGLKAACHDISEAYQQAQQVVRAGATTAAEEWHRLPEVRETNRRLDRSLSELWQAHNAYRDWSQSREAALWGPELGQKHQQEIYRARLHSRVAGYKARDVERNPELQQRAIGNAREHNRRVVQAEHDLGWLGPAQERATKGLERIQQRHHARERQQGDRQLEMSLGLSR